LKLGISILARELETKLNLLKKLETKIDYIEIGVDRLTDWKYIKKHSNKLRCFEINIHLPLDIANFMYNENYFEKIINLNLKLGRNYNIIYYNMHLGKKICEDRRLNLDIIVQKLKKIDKYIVDEYITIENIYQDYLLGNKRNDFNYIINNLKSKNIKFCYDIGHDFITKENFFEDIDILKNTKVIHLSNNNGEIDQHLGINLLEKNIFDEKYLKYLIGLNKDYYLLEVKDEYIKDDLIFFSSLKK
jgi:sugar phosphate isomerase/epimerase